MSIQPVSNQDPFPILPIPQQSPLVTYYQNYLGGASAEQALQFIQGLEQWMNAVFGNYANGLQEANNTLKKVIQENLQ
jgi:hypothetical protein